MQKLLATCSLFAFALCGAAAATAQCNGAANNLVSNCGFESGDFTGWSGTVAAGTAANEYSFVGTIDPLTQNAPYQGSNQAFLGTEDGTGTLSQTLATTAGTTYTIEFALANDLSSTTEYFNSLVATFGGTTLLSETNVAASGYTLYTYTETATGSSTTLTFTDRNDAGYFDLDSVSVAAAGGGTSVTPEPSSFLLMGTGLLGAVGAMRRRLMA